MATGREIFRLADNQIKQQINHLQHVAHLTGGLFSSPSCPAHPLGSRPHSSDHVCDHSPGQTRARDESKTKTTTVSVRCPSVRSCPVSLCFNEHSSKLSCKLGATRNGLTMAILSLRTSLSSAVLLQPAHAQRGRESISSRSIFPGPIIARFLSLHPLHVIELFCSHRPASKSDWSVWPDSSPFLSLLSFAYPSKQQQHQERSREKE